MQDHRNDEEYAAMIKNLHFYWNTIGGEGNPAMTKRIRNMCWNQGDWRFYFYYSVWQKKTLRIAKEIIRQQRDVVDADGVKHGIDILHQLNMIGFREPGMFWKLSRKTGIPLVWGPIGGMKQFPLIYGGSSKMRLFFFVKNIITRLQIRFKPSVRKMIKTSDAIISAITPSHEAIKKVYKKETIIINETGCDIIKTPLTEAQLDARDASKTLEVIWVGKFDFRKRLDIALKVVELANIHCNGTPRVRLNVYGSGTERQTAFANYLCEAYGVKEWVNFMGQQDADTIAEAMKRSNLMLFTSINEDTSTVIMEAITNQLPVVCFDCCGMSNVISEAIGRKIPLTNPERSADDFADALLFFHENREELRQRAINCIEYGKQFSWDSKMQRLMEIYDNAINKARKG